MRKKDRLKYKDYKWCFYRNGTRRSPPGLYQRYLVGFLGNQAVVRVKRNGTHCDLIDKDCVFDSREEANAFIAKGGVVRWVVVGNSFSRMDPPLDFFRAKVAFHGIERGHYFQQTKTVERLSDGKTFSSSRIQVFNTKEEAESAHRSLWNEAMRSAEENYGEHKAVYEWLLKKKPREKRALK